MLENPQQWHDFYEDRPCWVITHRDLPAIPGVDIRFASGDVRPVYEEMAAALPGRNIWRVAGGDLVGQFDEPTCSTRSGWACARSSSDGGRRCSHVGSPVTG
jgi:hypothetical protein